MAAEATLRISTSNGSLRFFLTGRRFSRFVAPPGHVFVTMLRGRRTDENTTYSPSVIGLLVSLNLAVENLPDADLVAILARRNPEAHGLIGDVAHIDLIGLKPLPNVLVELSCRGERQARSVLATTFEDYTIVPNLQSGYPTYTQCISRHCGRPHAWHPRALGRHEIRPACGQGGNSEPHTHVSKILHWHDTSCTPHHTTPPRRAAHPVPRRRATPRLRPRTCPHHPRHARLDRRHLDRLDARR